jgi:tetratricopeptide (TPR) repeat protein
MGRLDDALQAYDAATRDFPHDVFARTGRAEVLRAMGRLDDALQAYEDAVRDFPHDVVARNGRAVVLLAHSEFDRALAALPAATPVTDQDWIARHIRGMVYLRAGRTDEAAAVFGHGAKKCPYAEHRDYFRSALAVTRLRQRNPRGTGAIVDRIAATDLRPAAELLKVHCFGLLGDQERAAQAYRNARAAPQLPESAEIADELRRRYVDHRSASHSDEWLFDREVGLLVTLMAIFSATVARRQAWKA